MYPLNKDYKPSIISFIQNLRKHPFIIVETNGIKDTSFWRLFQSNEKPINYEIENTFLSERKSSIYS